VTPVIAGEFKTFYRSADPAAIHGVYQRKAGGFPLNKSGLTAFQEVYPN